MMDAQSLILFLGVGLVVGWLASQITSGQLGVMGDLLVGVVGAFMGGAFFKLLGISIGSGLVGAFAMALCGAVALLILLRLVGRPLTS